MKIRIVDSESGLSELENPWNKLAAQCPNHSIFSSYDYNSIAWKHFNSPNDRLFVLALYDGSELKAVAPMRITKQKIFYIPTRTIEFIAAWEGDKPSIIAPECEEVAWHAIFDFLSSEFVHWDVLKIAEQPQNSTLHTRIDTLSDKGYLCQITHDSISYYIDLTGSWDSYLATIRSRVKREWLKDRKKLETLTGGLSVEIISQPDRVTEALDRFIALEKKSWKGEAKIGVHSNPSRRLFYGELAQSMARKKQVEIFFLKAGDIDVAASIQYIYRDVVYGHQITYNTDYAKTTPGVQMMTYEFEHCFNRGLRKFDMLGMSPAHGVSSFKANWASGKEDTVQFLVLNKKIRMLPIIWWKKIKGIRRAL